MLESYPFVKQEDQKECGPVCLQMIIKYYKGYIDLEEDAFKLALKNLNK